MSQHFAAVKVGHIFKLEAFDAEGNLKWVEEQPNLVVNEGLDHYLDVTLKLSAQEAGWYIGLTDGSPTINAGDTMASHAGWAEVTGYSEATREVWTPGAVSGQSIDNSASVAEFSINATVTIGGAFFVSNSTKGGSAGTLMAVMALSADRNLVSGDTLRVTVTGTMASA